MVSMNNRPAIHLTADEAATKTLAWVRTQPGNTNRTDIELMPQAKKLLTRMIRAGAFTIADTLDKEAELRITRALHKPLA